MIKIRNEAEIELIKSACRVVANVFRQLKELIRPGISTEELDREAENLLEEFGAVSAFKGYRGYPANICTSINEEVVHSIPGKRRLKEGDIISLDIGAKLNGYFGDAAWTFPVGKVSEQIKKLLRVGKEALAKGVDKARVDNHLLDISDAIQQHVESSGFSVVRKFVGHGIGAQMHEEPEIPNFGRTGYGPLLKKGMVLAIEPMVNMGNFEVQILKDNWTAVTKDKKPSVHFEHTICITEKGSEVLTDWQ